MTDAAILMIASKGLDEKSFCVSNAKVENVVKAPRNPVTAKGCSHAGCPSDLEAMKPKRAPINKLPRILHVRMPTGIRCKRVCSAKACTADESANRDTAPKPPPMNM